MVGTGAAAATSPDLVTFTARSTPFKDGATAIATNGSIIVAVSNGEGCATSPDGITWTQRALPTQGNYGLVIWNGSIFCALTDNSVATSTDGITWASTTLPSDGTWMSLSWTGTVFVTVAAQGHVLASPNGITWTQQGDVGVNIMHATYSGSTHYALGAFPARVYTSIDNGQTWNALGVAASGGSKILVVGTTILVASIAVVYRSTDNAASWSTITGMINLAQAFRYLNGRYIEIGPETTIAAPSLAYSTNSTTWTKRTLPSCLTAIGGGCVAKSATKYCVVPKISTNETLVSGDGVNWVKGTLPSVSQWSAIAYNGSVFCAVSSITGTTAATSVDGITWTARTLSASRSWVDIAWNGTLFCALAANSTSVSTSTTGTSTWTTRTLPASVAWRRVIWNGSVFCAIAASTSTAATSPDGITWTARTLPASTSWNDIAWTETHLIAIASNGLCAASSDNGATWSARTSIPSGANWFSLNWTGADLIAYSFISGAAVAAISHDKGLTWTTTSMPEVESLMFSGSNSIITFD